MQRDVRARPEVEVDDAQRSALWARCWARCWARSRLALRLPLDARVLHSICRRLIRRLTLQAAGTRSIALSCSHYHLLHQPASTAPAIF
eukprot:5060240-Pleurochrysis_carterae.AAC.1